jgi:tRNA (guanine26-N2/guanine27-N2)-dimethyltransferase
MSDARSSSDITVPEGFALHTENTSHILISSKGEAFLNPVQEFNRDLSVACIRVWSEELNREKEAKWKQAQERRAKRDADVKVAQQEDRKKAKSENCVIRGFVTDIWHQAESGAQSNGSEGHSPGDDPATGSTSSEVNKREVRSSIFCKGAAEHNPKYRPHKFVLLEALSATGLRSIRYAKEIPLVRFVSEFCEQTYISYFMPFKVRHCE